ncbi:MAG: hypothetical protein P8R42_13975 [Candidatus Binatia bacterium]|nr:hypothetical protein [Candidatus Binatia bacterium]
MAASALRAASRSSAWQRADAEIGDCEQKLTEHGTPRIKFWLHIDLATQIERFKACEAAPYKKYKLSGDGDRNREKWDAYTVALEENGGAHQHRSGSVARHSSKRKEVRPDPSSEGRLPGSREGARLNPPWTRHHCAVVNL